MAKRQEKANQTATRSTNDRDVSGTVARTIQLVRSIAEASEPQTVTGLARALELPSSTVHRLLQLLREQGMVEGDPSTRRYVPGRELYRLGALLTERRSLAELAKPAMEHVVGVCNETCVLSSLLWHERRMVFIQQVESTHPLRFSMPLHQPLPLIWGATGISMVAMLSEEEAKEVLDQAEASPVSGEKPPSPTRFKKQLATVRDKGYALTESQKIPDSVGIASALLDHRGRPIGSIAITIPSSRFTRKDEGKLGALISSAALEISTSLGYSPNDEK